MVKDTVAAWLAKTDPSHTTQAAALRLLVVARAGKGTKALGREIDAFMGRQNSDGGWGQSRELPSDAYATGQALYALNQGGDLPVSDPVYCRGTQFLLRTQDEDGSWFVNKRAIPANRSQPSRVQRRRRRRTELGAYSSGRTILCASEGGRGGWAGLLARDRRRSAGCHREDDSEADDDQR